VNISKYKHPLLPFLFLLFLALIQPGCSKEPIREKRIDPDTTTTASYQDGLFIVNEGNYNWGNASVTYVDNKTNTVIQDIFTKANNRSLGDVAESMVIVGDKGYLLINNSNRIEVVSMKDFSSLAVITGLYSPRYMHVVDSTKAYVTNLQNYISIIDLKKNIVSGRIQTTSWTERLVPFNNFMLVSSIGKFSESTARRLARILVIDTRTDSIVDSIESGKEPVGIVIDKKQKVWVLCSGGYDQYEAPSLIRINPELRLVEKIFTFPDKAQIPSRLCINPGGDTMYYLKGDVYQMPVTSVALPVEPLVSADGRLLYGLDVHPVTGKIYVSDAKDYVQNGTACQYTVTGILVREYPAGRIPGSFCFSESSAK